MIYRLVLKRKGFIGLILQSQGNNLFYEARGGGGAKGALSPPLFGALFGAIYSAFFVLLSVGDFMGIFLRESFHHSSHTSNGMEPTSSVLQDAMM